MEGKVSENELMTSVLRNVVEQPLSLPGYANYILVLICKLLSLHCGSEYSNNKITCTFILFCKSWKKKNLFKVFSYAWCRCPLKRVWNKISQISKYFLEFLLFKMHWYPFSVLSCKLYVIKKTMITTCLRHLERLKVQKKTNLQWILIKYVVSLMILNYS